jgi:hypothetical protein
MSTIPHTGVPWRVLLLDTSDRHDPKWVLATVTAPGDVRPASAGDTEPDDVTRAWAAGRAGKLVPLKVTGWRVDR